MLDQLENLSLSEKDKEEYRGRIKNAPDHSKLIELEQLLTQLQEQETQDAVNKANTALRRYMTARLGEFDESQSAFPNLLEKLMGVVKKYTELFDNALNRKAVEGLEGKAQEEMDAHITEYEKTLTPAPGGDAGQGKPAAPGAQDNNPAGDAGQGKPAAPG
ncbi:TPA: hypothetical protein V0Q38_002096, partial [Streptococcus pneumoniae]|nr:hypothetical protein [Streptococcus pneumoniae]